MPGKRICGDQLGVSNGELGGAAAPTYRDRVEDDDDDELGPLPADRSEK